MSLNTDRMVLSTITLRHLALAEALETGAQLGFTRIDLGALPGVCDHVPFELDAAAVRSVTDTVRASGLTVSSVNGDIGDLNRPLSAAEQAQRDTHRDRLLEIAAGIGARALVLPNGALANEIIDSLDADLDLVANELVRVQAAADAAGVELWVEAPHLHRLANDLPRSRMLYSRLPESIGAVLDVSHIVASGGTAREYLGLVGDRVAHVHLRDAERGYIHHSIGNGTVDFVDTVAALTETGYDGAFALELETRDLENADRPAEALRAGLYISDLLAAATASTTTAPSHGK